MPLVGIEPMTKLLKKNAFSGDWTHDQALENQQPRHWDSMINLKKFRINSI